MVFSLHLLETGELESVANVNCFAKHLYQIRKFTLLELLAAISVFTILIVLLFQTISGMQSFWTQTQRKLQVVENAQRALRIVTADLKGMTANALDNEKIFVDATGVGVRDIAFIANNGSDYSSNSTLYEIGYEVNSNTLYRWKSGDSDVGKWNFLNASPAIWAADGSWGTSNRIVDGVIDFKIDLFKDDQNPPYYVQYDAGTDSDSLPAFAEISLTLIHPRVVDKSDVIRNRTRKTFKSSVEIGEY